MGKKAGIWTWFVLLKFSQKWKCFKRSQINNESLMISEHVLFANNHKNLIFKLETCVFTTSLQYLILPKNNLKKDAPC